MSKRVYQSLLFYLLSGLGISLTLKASIGVSSFNSLNVALAEILRLQVGTITTAVNLLFLLACWLLDPVKKISEYLAMTAALCSFGAVINVLTYRLLDQLTVASYWQQILLFACGTLIAGYGTGKVLKYQVLKFPIEKFCLLLSQKTPQARDFRFYRYGVDVVCVTVSLLASTIFGLTFFVREGTLISLFLLSGVISYAQK